jgi:signal transduction histidine kinase
VTRSGTADLRELIQQIRPVAVHGGGLGLALAELVNRFGRDHQIEPAFEWAAGRIEFAYHLSHEVYKLVQEALVNVRRHSAATRVRVRLEADADGARLLVEDNGKGLGFVGRRTHEQLAASHEGPRVLRERIEHMGGRLVVESSPTGTRLEMTFPYEIPD